MINIVLHGSLKDNFPAFEISATTVADAIEGWSRQCGLSDIPVSDRPIIDVVDFDSIEKLLARTTVTEIHLVPRMFGGGGKFGSIIMGAALIGLAFIPGLGQIAGVAISTALASAGIAMIISGVMQLFMKAPSVSNSEDPDPSKYLSSSGNTTKIGTLVSKGYGRFKLGGQYMSVQVNAKDMVYGSYPASI